MAQNAFLHFRNALDDWANVPSDELFVGNRAHERPLVSIMIPTYRRYELLAETVVSALAQDTDAPFEVVVVDNDPESNGLAALLEAVPAVRTANFRYLRNRENLGADGNVNRGVSEARGEWVSLLHDDDLLDPCFIRIMLADLAAHPHYDGLVCRKRGMDQRPVQFRHSRTQMLARRAREVAQFRGKLVRRIDARKLFWGCVVGNTVGFLARTEHIRAIGGFYPEEYPSADYFFYSRFASRYRLGETSRVLVTIRVMVNSLTRTDIQLACLGRGAQLQAAMAGSVLPGFWRKITPLLMMRQAAMTADHWQSQLTRGQLEEQLGFAVPRDRPALLYTLRTLLGGI